MIESYLIDTFKALTELSNLAENLDYDYISLDLETNSANEKLAEIWGIGISFTDTEGYYIPIRKKDGSRWWNKNEEITIYSFIKHYCRTKKLIGHNLIYDTLVLEYQTGLVFSDLIHADTILLKHTINEERPHGLKEIAVKYLGPWADLAQEELYANIEANGGSTTKDNLEMFKADTDILGRYCVWDTVLTRRLFDLFIPQLKEQGLEKFFFEEEVMPLYQVTIDMKRQGFPIDVEYFRTLHENIQGEINGLEKTILSDIKEYVTEYELSLLDEEFPCKRTGNFPKAYAKHYEIPTPLKDGKITLAKKEIEKISNAIGDTDLVAKEFYQWVLGDDSKAPKADEIQRQMFFEKYPEQTAVFNLGSNMDLGWLFFEKLKLKPLSKTEGGKPQCDDDFLESVKDRYPFVSKLVDYKRLQKLDSTYIMGVLERHIDGVLYSSFLQFGTTSGRYSSTNPNLQNLPRVKDDDAGLSPIVLRYVNSIKRGFISPNGYKILGADYSQLEPCCFANASGDERLRDVFRRGHDLYSQIAIDIFGLTDYSADKKAKNYLKNFFPEKRQLVKAFCLAVVYGAEATRISQIMDVEYGYAAKIIQDYLDAYPELRSYMERCTKEATVLGYVKNDFGRIRHLPQAKGIFTRWGNKILDPRYARQQGASDIRRIYKNALNQSCNFPIQSTAASIVNRAMIATYAEFKAKGLDAKIICQVHDEITCMVRDDQIVQAKEILKRCMETTTKISVPLYTAPSFGTNWSEAK